MKKIIYSLLFSIVLFSCDKSYEEITPSGLERNWLVIEDEGTTEMDKLRYKIFQETGIPIYYNDTIGSEVRVTPSGRTYTYYEKLQAFYNPGSGLSPDIKYRKMTLIEKERADELIPITQYIFDEVMPDLPENIHIPSILLAVKMSSPSDSIAHKGLNTILVGEALEFNSKNEEEKRVYKGAMLRSIVSGHLQNKEGQWLEDNFYSISYAANPKAPLGVYSYGKTNVTVIKAWEKFIPVVTNPELHTLGFIVTNDPEIPTTPEISWKTPTKVKDVNSYCEKLFSYSTDEIETEFADHKIILDKFEVLRKKLIELGFTFN